ncbi:MAG: hypothetical protein ACRC46_06970 [Thermoguttaceae bacterium]
MSTKFSLVIVFFLLICLPTSAADSLFDTDGFSFSQAVANLYDSGKLTEPETYHELRRVIVRQAIAENKVLLEKEWGKPSAPFVRWLEEHPGLLETFLTAIKPEYDDLSSSLGLMRKLCTDYPDEVVKYPGLAVAAAVVWDQPESKGFAHDSHQQFKATPPKSLCVAIDNFIFYTDPQHPAATRLQQLPWEMLVYVVANKRSLEERRWVLEQYVKDGNIDGNVPGKAYNDVHYNENDLKPGEDAALAGLEYSLQNIKQHGGVCTARSDYSLPVARTLGIPAFYGGAGFPRYKSGHSWIMWLDIKEVSPDRIEYEFREEGRGDPRFYVAAYENPQTGRLETDEEIRLRFQRLGKNEAAFRHANLLMRVYRPLLEAKQLSTDQRIDLLLKVNGLAPQNVEVWREIAALGKTRQFTLQHRQTILDLANKMREDLLDFPNELPGFTLNLIDFPEIREGHWDNYRWTVFEPLFNAVWSRRRPDVVFTTTINFNRLRTAGIRDKSGVEVPTDLHVRQFYDRKDQESVFNAIFMLKNLFHNYPNEITLMDAVFDEMESTAAIRKFGAENIVDLYYGEFAKRLTTDLSGLPNDYRRAVFQRIQRYAIQHDFPKRVTEMTEVLEKLDKTEEKKL